MIRKIILFPFLFSIFPVLILYSENIDEIPITDLLFPLLLTLISSFILFFIIKITLKNNIKAGLIITLIFTVFFSYGYILELLSSTILFDLDLVHQRYILPTFIILLILVSVLIIRFKKDLEDFNSILNIIGIVMILFISINIVTFYLQNENISSVSGFEIEQKIFEENNLPDIYHIILDEYTSSQVLLDDLDFDNSSFIEYLEYSNFHVLDNALSNYPQTEPVLSSILNLEYLDEVNLEKYGRLETESRINDNFVMKFLKQNGYTIIVPYSGYGSPDKFLSSDTILCSETIFLKNRFATELSRTTIINYFVEKQIENERRYIQECTFSILPTIANESNEPAYVFAHIFIPHAPYLFDKDGNHITPQSNKLKGLLGWDNKDGYLNELQFANKQMENIIKQILEKENESIIIIQGDTGTSILNNPNIEDYKKKRLSILFGIHLPMNDLVPENLSPVNTYRLIFNNYLNSDFQLLKNRHFWFSDFEENSVNEPKKFIEITKSLMD